MSPQAHNQPDLDRINGKIKS